MSNALECDMKRRMGNGKHALRCLLDIKARPCRQRVVTEIGLRAQSAPLLEVRPVSSHCRHVNWDFVGNCVCRAPPSEGLLLTQAHPPSSVVLLRLTESGSVCVFFTSRASPTVTHRAANTWPCNQTSLGPASWDVERADPRAVHVHYLADPKLRF